VKEPAAVFQPPRWLRDLKRFLPLKSQFVLSGNTRDLTAFEMEPGLVLAQSFVETLKESLYNQGYRGVILWSPTGGFSFLEPSRPGHNELWPDLLTRLGLESPDGSRAEGGLEALGRTIERLAALAEAPAALIIDFASRLVMRPGSLAAVEHQLFSRALAACLSARARPVPPSGRPFFNTVIWITEKEGDLPDWFIIDNPRLRAIAVSRPDAPAREALAAPLLRLLPDFSPRPADAQDQLAREFTDATEGLLLADLSAIVQLARSEELAAADIGEAVRRYKVGVTEDPWRKIRRDKIRTAEDFIGQRVKGQGQAVTHMLDIIKRAVTGIGGGRRGNRPRGVAFLAGPTGVGKTELAKTVTTLLFGDENSYIRFDMSEFSAEHADQRLLGAPPGYVGYEQGGELTGAVREKPFSVILFDEIEKAHPRLLDKFLQILDDGVLSSGRGERVYFSETLIIFTSNLGFNPLPGQEDQDMPRPADPFELNQARILAAIRHYFRHSLNRPELLNRIGENLIVFDYIRPESAGEIFQQMVDNIRGDLARQGFEISFAPAALENLGRLCLSDLAHGGRGIRNQMEAHLLNPLSREIFDRNIAPPSALRITALAPGHLDLEPAAP